MRSRLGKSLSSESAEINLSPLIDMVFILLIFFIVTTVFVEETGVQVEKPEARSAQDLERESLFFAVTSSGQVVFSGENVGVEGVRSIVRSRVAREPLPVVIEVDRRAESGLLVRVIDEAKLGGASQVSLATRLGGS